MIGLAGTLALLVILGTLLGLFDRQHFSMRWLLVAVVLVMINDAALTRVYGLLPDMIGGEWNWQGKLLALAATLAIAALPVFGWRRMGLTLLQEPGSLKAAIPVAALYCAFFVVLALVFSGGQPSGEEIAFQLTMPGLEEELFYRGTLLFALDQAFTGSKRFLGVDWGWGAILSCFLFGMGHAFGFADGSFFFDPVIMALTAIPSLIAVWLRLRTGSVLLPVLLHNFGNSFSLLI
ncbi:CPBP family intramembrane glutamic endopeptidase, BDIM_20840 family [Alterisphingorhabdus coralli]|uniref:CPBP family intramembrane glutamic endopeptidase n=1 Tax=Alterisphingorhabdus coralli TaxID=3071408 RepID=A0AA97FAJ8_9SPHN|nr:CPBP family intramembrane glutamic endopeptidase [Parasphingorhabdus sp. SCSIO 66989]WOE76611.1 CPBP family intramembrane glutamic endopeptidase [Parasphingorhabdus sp. SCSIO 66989]